MPNERMKRRKKEFLFLNLPAFVLAGSLHTRAKLTGGLDGPARLDGLPPQLRPDSLPRLI